MPVRSHTRSVDPQGRPAQGRPATVQYQYRMQVIGHQLHLIQPQVFEMIRQRKPFVQHEAPGVGRFQTRIRSGAHDAAEKMLPCAGA